MMSEGFRRVRLLMAFLLCFLSISQWEGLSISAVVPDEEEKTPHSIRGDDGKEMVYIPAGYFTMGNWQGMSDETPVRKIFLDAFYLDKYEVTNEEFRRFVDATGYRTAAEEKGWSWVVNMSWWDAQAYCAWAKKRLPTEAEWEKAARGIDQRQYPWGDSLPEEDGAFRANYKQGVASADGFEYTAPVGSFPRGQSPYGVMDMAGNVWEWVADWYEDKYYQKAWYRNPKGPSWGMFKVSRGGSWYESQASLRATARNQAFQIDWLHSFGFRCARDVP